VHFRLDVSGLDLGKLSGPASELKARVKFALSSEKLVLDPLLALAGIGTGPEPTDEEEAREEARLAALPEPPPVPLQRSVPSGLVLDGSIELGSIQMRDVSLGKFSQKISLARRLATVDTSLKGFDGLLTSQVRANLGVPGASYGYAATVAGFKVDRLLEAYAAYKPKKLWLKETRGKVFGSLALAVSGTGGGLNSKAIKRNLRAAGHFKLSHGKFSHLPILERVARAIPYPPAQEALKKDIDFDRCESNFVMLGGKFSWPDFVVDSGPDGRSGDLLLQSKGWLIPSGPVQMQVTPHFNPRLVKLEGDLAQYFQDDKGWATYDSIIYAGPHISEGRADFSQGVKNAAGRAIKKQTDELKKKAGDVLKEKAGDLFKNLPGGLFGK
jgi:hypothetical protein